MSLILALFGYLSILAALVAANCYVDRLLTPHGWRWRAARRLRRRVIKGAFTPERTIGHLWSVDPFVFEELVLLSFRKAGYHIQRNKRYTGDGGMDGRMSKGGRRWLLQMKRYGGHIDAADVRAFAELCREHGVYGAFVHTGRTGGGAREAVREAENVFIVSGERLWRLIARGEDVLKNLQQTK